MLLDWVDVNVPLFSKFQKTWLAAGGVYGHSLTQSIINQSVNHSLTHSLIVNGLYKVGLEIYMQCMRNPSAGGQGHDLEDEGQSHT